MRRPAIPFMSLAAARAKQRQRLTSHPALGRTSAHGPKIVLHSWCPANHLSSWIAKSTLLPIKTENTVLGPPSLAGACRRYKQPRHRGRRSPTGTEYPLTCRPRPCARHPPPPPHPIASTWANWSSTFPIIQIPGTRMSVCRVSFWLPKPNTKCSLPPAAARSLNPLN
jgi:hypothetical protein